MSQINSNQQRNTSNVSNILLFLILLVITLSAMINLSLFDKLIDLKEKELDLNSSSYNMLIDKQLQDNNLEDLLLEIGELQQYIKDNPDKVY